MAWVIDLVVNNMNYILRTKLSLSYVLVTLLMVTVISYFTNFLLEKQFKDYVMNQQEQKNKEIVSLITQ
jgi:two-component system sensor histidine kinase BaeS